MACAAVREFIQMHETNQAFSLYLSVFEFSVHKPTEPVTDVDDMVYAAGKNDDDETLLVSQTYKNILHECRTYHVSQLAFSYNERLDA